MGQVSMGKSTQWNKCQQDLSQWLLETKKKYARQFMLSKKEKDRFHSVNKYKSMEQVIQRLR